MNLERIRARIPKLNGEHHKHDGRHSEQKRKDATNLADYYRSEQGQQPFEMDTDPYTGGLVNGLYKVVDKLDKK